ncbi:MAG: hypothetical protein ACRDKY_01800 [Solirubrobacteraceae bacterium]
MRISLALIGVIAVAAFMSVSATALAQDDYQQEQTPTQSYPPEEQPPPPPPPVGDYDGENPPPNPPPPPDKIPYTGLPVAIVALLGVSLLAGGMVLRRRIN